MKQVNLSTVESLCDEIETEFDTWRDCDQNPEGARQALEAASELMRDMAEELDAHRAAAATSAAAAAKATGRCVAIDALDPARTLSEVLLALVGSQRSPVAEPVRLPCAAGGVLVDTAQGKRTAMLSLSFRELAEAD